MLLSAIFVVIIVLLVLKILEPGEIKNNIGLKDVQEGDIVLTRDNKFKSWLHRCSARFPFDHIAIVLKHSGELQLLEATSKLDLILSPLSEGLDRFHKYTIIPFNIKKYTLPSDFSDKAYKVFVDHKHIGFQKGYSRFVNALFKLYAKNIYNGLICTDIVSKVLDKCKIVPENKYDMTPRDIYELPFYAGFTNGSD